MVVRRFAASASRVRAGVGIQERNLISGNESMQLRLANRLGVDVCTVAAQVQQLYGTLGSAEDLAM
eukprot:scaffold2990_cov119-Isochrysis_galbana.AAC.3